MSNEMNKRGKKVQRGRTGNDLPPAMQGTEKGLVSGSREDVAHSAGRPARISMGNMKKLEVPSEMLEDGWYYRWIQGKEGKVGLAKAAY